MQKMLGLFLIFFFAFSSTFFIGEKFNSLPIGGVEAKVCPPGQYNDQGKDGLKNSNKCSGTETIIENKTQLNSLMKNVNDIYNIVAGILLAISIIAIIFVGYIYVDPFGTRMINAGGGKIMNVQDNENAKRYLIAIGFAIVILLSGFTILRMLTTIVGFSS